MDDDNKTERAVCPIRCPVCGSVNLAFTETFRRSPLRMIRAAAIAFYIVYIVLQFLWVDFSESFVKGFLSIFSGGFVTITIIFVLVLLILHVIIIGYESNMHTKGICRDCGHLWTLD